MDTLSLFSTWFNFICIFQQSLLRQLKVRRIFNTFNKSTRFQEAVRDFLSLSFLKPEDALDAAQSHVLPQFQFVGDAPEIEDEEGAKVEVFFKYLHVSFISINTHNLISGEGGLGGNVN